MTEKEEWRPVVGFEGFYEVSSLGRVRSLTRTVRQRCRWGGTMLKTYKGRILKIYRDDRERCFVNLCKLGANKRRNVAVLVAAAFLGPRPAGKIVCHGDGNPSNNTPTNLRYDTYAGNEADKKLHGTYLYGESCHAAKLTEDQVLEILASNRKGVDLAEELGVTAAAISAIRTGKNWAYLQSKAPL